MTQLRTKTPLLLVFTSTLLGCSEGGACTLSVEPGIVVEIRDGLDGAPIAATASGGVSEGSFQDSLRLYDGSLTRAGADERPGTYRVRVQHAGYATWERTGVQVRDNGCHVATVTLQADLERAP